MVVDHNERIRILKTRESNENMIHERRNRVFFRPEIYMLWIQRDNLFIDGSLAGHICIFCESIIMFGQWDSFFYQRVYKSRITSDKRNENNENLYELNSA